MAKRHFCIHNGYAAAGFDCDTVEEAISQALDESKRQNTKQWLSERIAEEPTFCYTSTTGKEVKAYTSNDFVEIGETSRKFDPKGGYCIGWEFLHHPYTSAL